METLEIIRNEDQVSDLLDYLKDKDVIAFDSETTGLSEDDEIIGFSVCAEPDLAYYVVLAEWDKDAKVLKPTAVKQCSKTIINLLSQKQLVMHNAIFDCKMVNRWYNIDLMPSVVIDTLILGHLLDENRSNALKELAANIFGADAKAEQKEMAASVIANGGIAKINEKSHHIEIYKADSQLIGKYGAKDAILTYRLMVYFLDELKDDSSLWRFFFDDECMPLLKGPTYSLNTIGFKVDTKKLEALEVELNFELLKLEERIDTAIKEFIVELYPGTNVKNTFNINSNDQISWLLFIRLGLEFKRLTQKGRTIAKQLIGEIPYSFKKKKEFIQACKDAGMKPEKLIMADKVSLEAFKNKFSWISDLLEYKRLKKLLTTYVEGIKERTKYGVIKPSFLQHGTTSGRYSSNNPNFQNLPREDKRIKSCLIARPGKVFVGADHSQLEPRVFASFSQDIALLKCFEKGEDFYSVIGAYVFDIHDCSMFKNDKDSFAEKHKGLRHISKVIGLSVTYGTTAYKMVDAIKGENDEKYTIEECQKIISDYLEAFPGVKTFMDSMHLKAIHTGESFSLFGRPRRIPEAKRLRTFGNFRHDRLPYELRTPLNLAVNHAIQSTAASIINRGAIALHNELKRCKIEGEIILQVHDSLVVECREDQAEEVVKLMKQCMEDTVKLDGVKLIAEPKIGKNLSEV